METWRRICIEDYTLTAQNGDCLVLRRGQEYLTFSERDGHVTVFGRYWAPVPMKVFAGSQLFTPASNVRGAGGP